MNELKRDSSVTNTQINVTSKNGIVTLRGSVPHYYDKTSAEEATQRVGGVRAIADEIEVDLLSSYERNDVEIAEAALNALKWDDSVPKNLKVTVEKGWITLKGETDGDFERTAAKNAVKNLMGVRGVSNNITLNTKILQRSSEADGRK